MARDMIYILALLTAVFMLLDSRKIGMKRLILLALLSGTIAIILTMLMGELFNNPRPFVESGIAPLIPHQASNGMPSNHTVAAVLASLLVWELSKKISISLISVALLIGFARVQADVHHIEDVLIGFVVALIAYLLARRILYILILRNKKGSWYR